MGQQRKGTVGPAGAEKAPVWRTVVKAFPLFILGFLALAVLNTLVDFSSVSLLGTTLADLLKQQQIPHYRGPGGCGLQDQPPGPVHQGL